MFGMMEALLSFLRRQVGLREDTASPTGSLHAKIADLKIDLPKLVDRLAQASNNLVESADTERSLVATSVYTKKKEIQVPIDGIIRVSFDLKRGAEYNQGAFGIIYKNGEAVGTERSTASTSYTTYTEDIAVSSMDLVQLYIKSGSNAQASAECRNFRLYYDVTNGPLVTLD